jgi:hypothetical protein
MKLNELNNDYGIMMSYIQCVQVFSISGRPGVPRHVIRTRVDQSTRDLDEV